MSLSPENRACPCHPDDAPTPCQHGYALSVCLRSALLENEREVERLAALVYVPGVTRCAKCGLRLVSSTLHAGTGAVTANTSPQDCLNGCGPMWRVTERDAGNDLCDRLDASQEQVKLLSGIVSVVLQCDREALADHRPKWGLADCVDNDGKPYQSQFLGDALAKARETLQRLRGEG